MPTELSLAYGHLFVAVYEGRLDDVLAAHGMTRRQVLDMHEVNAMRLATGWLRDEPDSVRRSALAAELFGRRGAEVLAEMALPTPHSRNALSHG